MRSTVRVMLLVLAALAEPSSAAAHAMLEWARPRVGGVVAVAPSELRLHFSKAIDPELSIVDVRTAAGKIDTAPPALDPGDERQLVVAIGAPLRPGRYRVMWRVVCRDYHTTEGEFTFEVAS